MLSPMQHAVELVKALRVAVFPLRPNEKVPLLSDSWKEISSSDVATVEAWAKKHPSANYGIDCGKSGLIVVDIDVKKDKPGMAEWTKLTEGQPVTDTRVVTTPSYGTHLYFKGLTDSHNAFRPGIDIKSVGGYVVGPGSQIDGNSYGDRKNSMIVPVWPWLQAVLGAPKAVEFSELPEAPLFTKPADRARAIAYLADAPVAVEGQSGDALTFQIACKLKDFGVCETDAVTLMLGDWNAACQPPWTEEELTAKIANAYKYGKKAPASDSFSVFEEPPKPEDMIVLAGKYACTPPPPRHWVIEGWLPRGYATLFCGKGGVGKSEALLQLGIAVSSGLNWMGLPTKAMPALYVSCEDDKDEVHRRIYGMTRAAEYSVIDLQKQPFYIFHRTGYETMLLKVDKRGEMIDGGFLPILEKQIATAMPPGPKLIIIDTVPDTFGGNENDRSHVNRYVKTTLGMLSQKYECTFILNSHPAKAEGSEYSGSTAWNNAVRARIEMKMHEEDGYRMLTVHKLNHGKDGSTLVVKRGADGVYRQSSTDDMMAEPCQLVYAEIVRTQDTPKWLSTAKVAFHSLHSHKIVDRKGRPLSESVKEMAVARLMEKGMITEVEVKGNKAMALKANEMGDIFG